MKKLVKLSIASAALVVTLLFSGGVLAAQTAPAKDTKTKTAAKPAATSSPSEQGIADAKAKGLVWVNTNTKVYHKDGQFYGKTKQGKFMTEADAQKAGYRPAKESAVSKKKSGVIKK